MGVKGGEMTDITYIYEPSSSFEAQDRQILERHFDVDSIRKPHGLSDWMRYWRDLGRIMDSKAVLVWFAGWPAYLAMISAREAKVPIGVIIGGYDVAREPSIGYGATLHLKERWSTMQTLKGASLCLSVSQHTGGELVDRCKPRDHIVIENGVDIEAFHPDGEKAPIVLTVGAINERNYVKKGYESFIQAARRLPEYQFHLVGGGNEELMERIDVASPPNLTLTGYLDKKDLIREYQTASVYVQPSAHESFGVAVVEAMLCGCVPVVSDRGALPEVVGDAGLIFPYDSADIYSLVFRIKEAMAADQTWREAVRARGERFSLQERETRLEAAMRYLIEKGKGAEE